MPPATKRTYWPPEAKHIHVMGEIRKVERHGSGRIAGLYLYEKSVCRGDEPSELPPARAHAIIGACDGIECTICHELVDWTEPPLESYVRLMGHYPRSKNEPV